MTDAIARALAAAEQEAGTHGGGEAAPEVSTAGAVTTAPQGGAVATAAPGKPRTLAHLMESASMNVDAFLKVSHLGIFVGKDLKPQDELFVEMKLENAKAGWVLRINTGAGVKYLTSYDGVQEAKTRANWAAIIADAQKMDANAYVSDLIEMPALLLKDVPLKEKGKFQKAGTVVGLSLSYKNLQAFQAVLGDLHKKYGLDRAFKVKLTAVPKVGSGQDYGVYGYEEIDEVPA